MGKPLEELIHWPSIREMCQQTGTCQNSGYNWVWQGKVEAFQVFGVWRINPKDVERIRREREARRARRVHQQREAINA